VHFWTGDDARHVTKFFKMSRRTRWCHDIPVADLQENKYLTIFSSSTSTASRATRLLQRKVVRTSGFALMTSRGTLTSGCIGFGVSSSSFSRSCDTAMPSDHQTTRFGMQHKAIQRAAKLANIMEYAPDLTSMPAILRESVGPLSLGGDPSPPTAPVSAGMASPARCPALDDLYTDVCAVFYIPRPSL